MKTKKFKEYVLNLIGLEAFEKVESLLDNVRPHSRDIYIDCIVYGFDACNSIEICEVIFDMTCVSTMSVSDIIRMMGSYKSGFEAGEIFRKLIKNFRGETSANMFTTEKLFNLQPLNTKTTTLGEFIDKAAIAAMAAIVSNEKLLTQCMDEASLQKIKIADRVANMAFEYADAMRVEHKKRFDNK